MSGTNTVTEEGLFPSRIMSPFVTDNTHDNYVEFLYEKPDGSHSLKYMRTTHNWIKIQTVATICAYLHHDFPQAKKLLEIIMDAEDAYTEE